MDKKIAITTDSNSGLLPEEYKDLSVFVLPMPFLINGENYFEGINLTQEKFYELLDDNAEVSTSQPSVGDLTDFWDNILKDYDEIIHIPMSSGLSRACETAQTFSKEYNGKITVVDNKRISVTLKDAILDAVKLRDSGKNSQEIKSYLEETGLLSSVYIAVDTMKYLKKGGRVTPAAAAIGGLLRIKPVLRYSGEKFGKLTMVHNIKKAKDAMISAVREGLETKFKEYVNKGEIEISVAHTQNFEQASIFFKEIKEVFPNIEMRFCDPLSLSVSCHIGPGALAIAVTKILK